ncbi:BrnA antitoxin family protein [Methylobacterium nonmethylotrophicum]|uniref:Uncharacterized protein n=1 Tax=Methylobacterium nonmethylotrophicum TaxID=1141884 RepID=A0A4Z0NR65_9HYPH|nr:BrnA antitoxin family protein [Methylobacterium nonmethylotrophicum]TGD98683.1 hypothetical protein EU555_15195 [Methylobacterium nonmethylotrophicum]
MTEEDDFRAAVPLRGAFPELYAGLMEDRAAIAAGRETGVTLTRDADIVARLTATTPGWTARMADALRRSAEALPPP